MPVLSQKALHSSSQEGCGLQNKPRLQCSYTAVPSCSWPAATSASSLVIDGNRCCRNGLQHVWDHAYPLLLAHGRGDQTVLMLSATLAEAVVPPGAVVSGVSPCSLLILCTALFSSLWAWNYCSATVLLQLFGLDFPLPWFLPCGTVSRHGADSTHICQDSFTCASSSILQSSLLEHEMVEYKVGRFLSVFLSSAALVIFEFFLSVRQFWRLTWQGELSGPLKSQ